MKINQFMVETIDGKPVYRTYRGNTLDAGTPDKFHPKGNPRATILEDEDMASNKRHAERSLGQPVKLIPAGQTEVLYI